MQVLLPSAHRRYGLARSARDQASRHRTANSPQRLVPRFEALEQRTVLSTFTVLNLNDSGDGSLRAAVAAAEANPGPDVVDFAPKVHGTIGLTSGQIIITTDLTIDGPGASVLTISGNHLSRIFLVLGGDEVSNSIEINISGLSFTDGRAAVGGGIVNAGFSDMTLSRTMLTDNAAVGFGNFASRANGGALQNNGNGRMTLIDSLVTGNIATANVAHPSPDGPIYPYNALGGGITNLNGAKLAVINSTISGNQTIGPPQSGYPIGGGIHQNVGSELTIVNSTIADNEVVGSDYGGGGGISSSSATLSISNSAIETNRVIGDIALGGGVRARGSIGNVNVFDGVIAGNQTIGDLAWGGGIFTDRTGTFNITGSTVSGNQAVGTDDTNYGTAFGGAITNFGSSVSITDSKLSGNLAIGGNGGSGPGYLSTFVGVGNAFGGAIYNGFGYYGGKLQIDRSTLTGNQAIGGDIATQQFEDAIVRIGSGHGGAIHNTFGSEAIIRASTIAHNRAIGGGGNTDSAMVAVIGVGNGGGINNAFEEVLVFGLGTPRVSVIDSIIVHNEALGGDNNSGSGEVALVGAGLGGGVANYLGATTDVSDSLLAHNRARGGVGNLVDGGSVPAGLAAGGAVFNGLGRFQFDFGTTLADSVVNIDGSHVVSNKAEGDGGGDAWGGAIATLFNATTNADRTVLSRNRAIGGAGASGANGGNALGAGIFNDETSLLTLTRSLVALNRAKGGRAGTGGDDGDGIGGGVYNLGDFDLDELTLIHLNKASTSHDDVFGDFDII